MREEITSRATPAAPNDAVLGRADPALPPLLRVAAPRLAEPKRASPAVRPAPAWFLRG